MMSSHSSRYKLTQSAVTAMRAGRRNCCRIFITIKKPRLKRRGFLVSPGSNESQGGGGLKLLPGAIGLKCFRVSLSMNVCVSKLFCSTPSCVNGTYSDSKNGSRHLRCLQTSDHLKLQHVQTPQFIDFRLLSECFGISCRLLVDQNS